MVKEKEEKEKCVQWLFVDWQNLVSVLYAWTHTKLFSGELLNFRYKVQPKEKALGWWRRHATPFNNLATIGGEDLFSVFCSCSLPHIENS